MHRNHCAGKGRVLISREPDISGPVLSPAVEPPQQLQLELNAWAATVRQVVRKVLQFFLLTEPLIRG